MLQFSDRIGPLVKIVTKMANDFSNFLILYVILTAMFSIILNMNFIYELRECESLFEAILTVVDASLGNFDFKIFDKVKDPGM